MYGVLSLSLSLTIPIQVQAKIKKHFSNYLCVQPININMLVILIHKCVDIIQSQFKDQ